jgi:hypothetical protein
MDTNLCQYSCPLPLAALSLPLCQLGKGLSPNRLPSRFEGVSEGWVVFPCVHPFWPTNASFEQTCTANPAPNLEPPSAPILVLLAASIVIDRGLGELRNETPDGSLRKVRLPCQPQCNKLQSSPVLLCSFCSVTASQNSHCLLL